MRFISASPSPVRPPQHRHGRLVLCQQTMLPIMATEREVISCVPLPWDGRDNILAAAGAVFLDMVAGDGR